MEFLSQNGHISPERARPDTLTVDVRTNLLGDPRSAVLRFEWQLSNGCIDASQLPGFREFLDHFGPA